MKLGSLCQQVGVVYSLCSTEDLLSAHEHVVWITPLLFCIKKRCAYLKMLCCTAVMLCFTVVSKLLLRHKTSRQTWWSATAWVSQNPNESHSIDQKLTAPTSLAKYLSSISRSVDSKTHGTAIREELLRGQENTGFGIPTGSHKGGQNFSCTVTESCLF